MHASLLPQYRGAAPIQWAILNGETKTGVTTFFLDEHTDTGAIIRQTEVEITPTDTGGTLHDKLMEAGADIAVQTLHDIESGTVQTLPQPEAANLKPAPKIFKEDMLICWDDTAENIYNKIRGLALPHRLHPHYGPTGHRGRTGKSFPHQGLPSLCHGHCQHLKTWHHYPRKQQKMLVSSKNREISIEILQFEGKNE